MPKGLFSLIGYGKEDVFWTKPEYPVTEQQRIEMDRKREELSKDIIEICARLDQEYLESERKNRSSVLVLLRKMFALE